MLTMTKQRPDDGQKPNAPSALPARSAGDLKALAMALTALSALGHEKMTLRQALYFIAIGHAKAMGHSVTTHQLMEVYEPLGRSITKSKEIFMAPSAREPNGLNWVTQTTDEVGDRRAKYLDLTEDGLDTIATMVEAMRQAH